jgi:hypothetical protein
MNKATPTAVSTRASMIRTDGSGRIESCAV